MTLYIIEFSVSLITLFPPSFPFLGANGYRRGSSRCVGYTFSPPLLVRTWRSIRNHADYTYNANRSHTVLLSLGSGRYR
jgi:hypothetical protein